MKKILSVALLISLSVTGLAQAANLTAITINATDIDGVLFAGERWNTIGPHPAWDVWLKDGAIPGNEILNTIRGQIPDRFIDIPLTNGVHTFTTGVSHTVGGDACCDAYSLNLFIDGDPRAGFDDQDEPLPMTSENEQSPAITGWVEIDWDGPDVGETFLFSDQDPDGTTMGFLLDTVPPAFTDYTAADGTVIELVDYAIYAKEAGLDIDVMSPGGTGAVGDFIPDGEPDIVAEFTLEVSNAPVECLDGVSCGRSDINMNGDVDFADFVILSTDFGKTSPHQAGGVANIPEPSAVALLMIGGLAVLLRRRP